MANKTETTKETPDHSEGVKILIHDTVWNVKYNQLCYGENNFLQIDEQGRVSCRGHHQWPSTHFKVLYGKERNDNNEYPETLMLFECIGGKWAGYMLCVDKEGRLSCQEKTKDYINIQDAEKEVQFIRKFCDKNGCFALKSKFGGYVGFDKRGEAKDLKCVDAEEQPECEFQMQSF